MEQKSLPEQVVELIDGIIDIEQAELLIKKIRIAYDHPKEWVACFPGCNTGQNLGLSRQQLISVWGLVERSIQQEAAQLPGKKKKIIKPINVSARIQGFILLNAKMDFDIAQRRQNQDL